MSKQHVLKEISSALNTFTSEGYADMVAFASGDGAAEAEEYGSEGEILARYRVTFKVELIGGRDE